MGEPERAVVVIRRALLPGETAPVGAVVDDGPQSAAISLLPDGARIVLLSALDDESALDSVLRFALRAKRTRDAHGRAALVGLERVELTAIEADDGQVQVRAEVPADTDGAHGRATQAALVALRRAIGRDPALDALFDALEGGSKSNTHTNGRLVDRALALTALALPFEVRATALVEPAGAARLALLVAELARKESGRPLDAATTRALRAHVFHRSPRAAETDDASRDPRVQRAGRPLVDDERTAQRGARAPVVEEEARAPRVYGGRFRAEALLGEGAQGHTWRAIDVKSGQTVALKVFTLASAHAWKNQELFEREVATLRALGDVHPGIPALVDVVTEDEGAVRALAMTFIEGSDLHTVRASRGRLGARDIEDLLEQILEILALLHARDPPIVHRDVKPRNIIARPSGHLALVDYGSVSLARESAGSTLVGTYGFMAPEQLYGAVGPATDIYALGATALALATGREPEELPRRGLAIDVEAAWPSAPSHLARTLREMTAPDPSARANDARTLLSTVQRRRVGRDGALTRLVDRIRRRP